MSPALSSYEQSASLEIEKWKAKSPSRTSAALGRVTKVIDRPTAWVMDHTVVGRVLEGILAVAMDAGTWAVPETRVLEAYRDRGIELSSFDEIRQGVPLQARDREAARLDRAYRAQLGAEGGAAGAAAFAGPGVAVGALVADISFVTTWACRAAAHHAAVYGYRTETPGERALAMQVLVGATSATDSAKQAALAQIAQLSQQVAKKKAWAELEKSALVKAIQEAADKLGVNLTKAKLGQVVAVLGVLIGAGYNMWYIGKVCEWSYYTYRDHYLEDKAAGFPSWEKRSGEESGV